MADGESNENALGKAYVVEFEPPTPKADPAANELEARWGRVGAIPPPHDPRILCLNYKKSTLLRPNVDAYEANIDRNGWRLEPKINFDAPDIAVTIKHLIYQEARASGETPNEEKMGELIRARIATLREEAALEELEIKTFFANCAYPKTFEALRGESRQEKESTGNAYWEVLRDQDEDICRFNRIDCTTMRIRAMGQDLVDVEVPIFISDIKIVMKTAKQRFRSYVQMVANVETVFFKELGDPRVMSSRSGNYYASLDEMRRKERGATPATEVLHWPIFQPGEGPYGIPRWIGATPAVTGTWASEEVNSDFFHENAIPNAILSLNGGKWASGAIEAITHYLNQHHKGVKNKQRILVLDTGALTETITGTFQSVPEIKIDTLEGTLQKDGHFQEYEKNNELRVGQQFRLPKFYRGDSTDMNRSTSETTKEMVNEQVFAPERQKDDDVINARIFPAMGWRYWRFASGLIKKADPTQRQELVLGSFEKGLLRLNEARKMLTEVFGKELDTIEDERGNKFYFELNKPSAADSVRELAGMREGVARESAAQRSKARHAARKDPPKDPEDDEP